MKDSRKVRVQVTEEHIRRGQSGTCFTCPIALALHDAGIAGAIVGYPCWKPDPVLDFRPLPLVAQAFVSDFDAGRPVQPFAFTVTVPATAPTAYGLELARQQAESRQRREA